MVPGGRCAGHVARDRRGCWRRRRGPRAATAARAGYADGGEREHDERGAEGGRDRQHRPGQPRGVELHEREDRQRVGVVGEDDRGPELGERPQPREQQAGRQTRERGGDRDPREAGEAAMAERGGHVLERGIDGGEGGPGDDDHERRGDVGLCEHDSRTGVREAPVEQAPGRGVGADDVEQQQPTDERRQRERERDEDPEQTRGGAASVREEVRQRRAQQCDQGGADRRRQQRRPQRRPEAGGRACAAAEADQEGGDRGQQIQREEPAEPGQRAPRARAQPPQCAPTSRRSVLGTADGRPENRGVIGCSPSRLSVYARAAPSR